MENKILIRNVFFYLAAFVLIIAGMKAASEIIIILLLAIFISSIFNNLLNYLQSKSIPKLFSYLLILLASMGIILFVFYLFNSSISNFSQNIPIYEEKIRVLILNVIKIAEDYGYILDQDEILGLINFNYLFKFTSDIISNIGVVLSKILLVLIGVAFILSESKIFEKKINMIFSGDKTKLHNVQQFSSNLQKYFTVKTFTSFLTGLLIFFTLIFFNIEYAILWAFVAFLFNFIPVVGSIVAAIPAILLSLIMGNIDSTLWLIIIYVVVNISISNVIEPKLMGKELGLSPMVIFFSLIFWGYILGIVGMFLAVPITMSLKIAFESSQNSKWLGILMSSLGNKS